MRIRMRMLSMGMAVIFLTGCGAVRQELSESREVSGPSETRKTEDGREEADGLLTREKRLELEKEALRAADQVGEVYKNAAAVSETSGVWGAAELTKEQCLEAVRLLKEAGCVSVSDHINMENYEEVLVFYDTYVSGREAEVTVYQANRDGTLTALTFVCRDGRIQTCHIGIGWRDGDTPEVTDTVVRDIAEIKLTEKGYLIYGYESAPAHSVLRQYLRVKPLSDRCRELTEKYVYGLSYVNYNVLVINWNEDNAEDILTPCMFEDIYRIDTGENLRAENGMIPADEYERIMTQYFPVTEQQVREKCGYDKNSRSYPYEMILGKQYPPFGEVVDYTENADGTITLYVDGVWPDYDSDCAFVNRLTVRPFEDGTFRYLSNVIEKRELDIPGNQTEKGYDLPVEVGEREEAERDCFAKLQLVRDLFPAYRGGDDSSEISDEQIERAADRIAEDGCCVMAVGEYAGMENYERLEAFLERAAKGEEGEEILYKISRSGMISRQKYKSDGKDLYVISAVASWQSGGEPVLNYLTRTRVKEWRVTEKGWFCYRLCVPEYPEVTEVVDGSCMVRVVPMTDENREMSERCVLPVAYKGNNLFCCDWDAEHMEELDYNGLYEYLYQMKYGENFPVEEYRGGIPAEEFESLMTEYLPVTEEELRRFAVYDGENRTYAWEMQEYSNDAPVFFSAAVPEVTDIREHEDGTVTLKVDAVCEMLLCDDAAITHEVRVRFEEDGSFRYLGNKMIYCGENGMPEYRERIRERE